MESFRKGFDGAQGSTILRMMRSRMRGTGRMMRGMVMGSRGFLMALCTRELGRRGG